MEPDEEKMFLENIEEFVMDEEKIVTYKWLSTTLNLHVNTAKQLLCRYAMPNNKRRDNVHVTYLVAGVLLDGSGVKIQIVRENDLEKVKSQFKLLTSEHVYSVQHASHLPDLNILYAIDNPKNEKADDSFGAIRCEKAIRRLENDIESLQSKARAATAMVVNPVSNGKKIPSNSVKSISDNGNRPRPIESAKTGAPTAETDPKSASTDSTTIASMFTAQAKANQNSNHKAGCAANSKRPAAKKSQGGIAMFFTKQSPKPSTNIETKNNLQDVKSIPKADSDTTTTHVTEPVIHKDKPASTKESNKHETDNTTEGKDKKQSDKVKENNNGKKNQKVSTNGKQTKSGQGKKRRSVEDKVPAKKRKRIMVMSDDSSEDDIFGNDSDTDMPPPSPEKLPEELPRSQSSDEDVIPSTPLSQLAPNGKIRKRKLVDKTFEDKDGFIMTKKEYVFESCSEGEGDADKQSEENHVNDSVKKSILGSVETRANVEDVEIEKPSKKAAKDEKQKPTRKKKASPPIAQKSKQSTLMSFFNKN